MKKRIYRYIAIALAVAALLVALIEVLIYGFPLFAFFFVAGAKDFYDSSVGKVTAASKDYKRLFPHSYTPTPESPHICPFADHHGTSESWARGEHPSGGGRMTDPY